MKDSIRTALESKSALAYQETATAAPVPSMDVESIVSQSLVAYGQHHVICCLHWAGFKEERPFRTKRDETYKHVYQMNGVESIDSPPELLIVTDAFERVYGGRDIENRKIYNDKPILSLHIANDLIRAATNGEPDLGPSDTAHFALWISKASKLPTDWTAWGTPEFKRRYPEFARECEAYKRREWAACEAKVKMGDYYHSKRMVHEIGDQHRRCAKFIGANQAEHPWIDFTTFGKTIPCPYCGAATSSTHPKCQHCHEIIDIETYERQTNERDRKLEALRKKSQSAGVAVAEAPALEGPTDTTF